MSPLSLSERADERSASIPCIRSGCLGIHNQGHIRLVLEPGIVNCEDKFTSSRERGRTMERFGFPSMTPSMGPFPLRDNWGMKAAVAILDRTFDPRTYEAKV
mmetsp:Transcript_22938/g.34787  ORF Transcript_22938/g.34787 Transcript_22938/m.34787 type:complete len:102 (-) Transcript_22938:1266-1571(-)